MYSLYSFVFNLVFAIVKVLFSIYMTVIDMVDFYYCIIGPLPAPW
jgi:hypothetical protein